MVISARVRRQKLLSAAQGYLMLEMPDQALEHLSAIADPHNCAFEYHQLRGEALREKRSFEKAISAYRCAQAENAIDLSVSLGIAWCYKRIDRVDLAIETLEDAYRWSPDEPIVLYNLACYYSLTGDKNQSLMWLGRSLRMDAKLRRLIPDETDFDTLRDDPDFQLITRASDDARRKT